MREGIPIRDQAEARVVEQPKATPGVFFVDCETTGLMNHHEVWEVALILPNGEEHEWQLPINSMTSADPKALQIGGFLDRYDSTRAVPHDAFGKMFTKLTWGLHWAGAVPSFDETRIRRIIEQADYYGMQMGPGVNTGGLYLPPNWHYHLIDVEALAVGFLIGESQYELVLPWDSTHLAEAVGVDRDDPAFAKHTAIGDARWARAIYLAVMERRPPEKEEPF